MSPNPVVVTMPARPILPSISALVISVVACTIGAVMSAGSHAGLGQQLTHAGAHAVERRGRRGQRLVDDDPPAGGVEQHDVGERAADVDGQAPVGAVELSALAQVLARRSEHVEDPDLAVLVVADEDAVAVPDGSRAR